MTSRKKARRLWEWHRMNMTESVLAIFLYLFGAIILGIISFTEDNIIIFIMVPIIIVMILLFIPFIIGVIRQRKNMWLKHVPYENIFAINIIENLLVRESIPYKKQSLIGPIKSFPLKYIEIFELYNSALLIRMQKQTSRGTIVELGPITNTNNLQIMHIKNMIDNVFRPQIL